MATTLQSLPNELQREIIKDISLPDLLDLRLVSLHFCDLMLNFIGPFSSTYRPKVYHKESDHDRVMTGILTQTLTALSILKGLGSRLESLSISCIRDFPDPNFPPNEDLRPLLEGLKTLNFHMTEPWDSQKCSRFSSEKCHPVQRLPQPLAGANSRKSDNVESIPRQLLGMAP